MRALATLFLLLLNAALVSAQVQRIMAPSIRTLTVIVDGDPTLPPFVSLGKRQGVCI